MKDFTFTTEQFLDFLAEKDYLKSYDGLLAGQHSNWGPSTSLANRNLLTFLEEEFNLLEKFQDYIEYIPSKWVFHSFGNGKMTLEEEAYSFDTDFFIDLEPLIKQLISNDGNLDSEEGYKEIYYYAEVHINDAEDKNSLSIGVHVNNIEIEVDLSPQQEAEILEFIIESFKDQAYHYEFTDYPTDLTLESDQSSYTIIKNRTVDYAKYLSDKALESTVWIFNEIELFDADAKIRFAPSELDV